MSDLKFELTTEFKIHSGIKLFRIKALKSFSHISKGDLGGWIEKEYNLDQNSNAWVYGDALVYGSAWVCGDALVYGSTRVYGDAWVYGDAQVYGSARVYGSAQVYGSAWVCGDARVYGSAWVSGDAQVYGDALVYGDAWVSGDARILKSTDIINFIISFKFSITITPQNIAIGCKLMKRSEWLKVTEIEAEKMGLPKELYPHYRQLIKTGMKLVKKAKTVKET